MSWNYYAPKQLRVWGVSEHTPDFSDVVITSKAMRVAYCRSRKCAGGQVSAGVVKRVRFEDDICPHCGNYLFWQFKRVKTPRQPQ